jgi:hypothetical protein
MRISFQDYFFFYHSEKFFRFSAGVHVNLILDYQRIAWITCHQMWQNSLEDTFMLILKDAFIIEYTFLYLKKSFFKFEYLIYSTLSE